MLFDLPIGSTDLLFRLAYRVAAYTQTLLLAFIVTLLFGRQRSPRKIDSPSRILLLRNGGLGDFLFAVPAMRMLRLAHPNAIIMLLTTQSTLKDHSGRIAAYTGGAAELPWLEFIQGKFVDEVLIFTSVNLRTLVSTVQPKITEFDPDVAVILPAPRERFRSIAKKLLFLKLVGVDRRWILGWKPIAYSLFIKRHLSWGLTRHRIFGPLSGISELVPSAARDNSMIDFDLKVNSNALTWANTWVSERVGEGGFVVFAPGSIIEHKNWPLERYMELGSMLLARESDIKIIVIGPAKDEELGLRLTAALGEGCINLAGKISMSQLAALLTKAKVTVGNDGGAMHLAAAMRCPCVTVGNGINEEGSIEPWFSRSIFIRHSVPCAPCFSDLSCPMTHNRCVKDIQAQDVVARLAEFL